MNLKHQPFAIKYRPKNLKDLIGQDVLIRIINNAIKYQKLANAYLLTGIRGIGKTTTARIIAKIVNCDKPLTSKSNDAQSQNSNNYKGFSNHSNLNDSEILEACLECENCKSFDQHPDIIEMDAASHTSVEDAKDIIEQSGYKPLLGKYKIFIIDEVHMLSKSAFNALLKSIEEPDEQVIFIFATTEINKVPLTIISRCQRFDLKRLGIADLMFLIDRVSNNENIVVNEKAMLVLSEKSGGSARDCLSLLEQVSTMSLNTEITQEVVENALGTASTKDIIEIIQCIISYDFSHILNIIQKLWEKNTDLTLLLKDIISFIAYITKIIVLYEQHVNANIDQTENVDIHKVVLDENQYLISQYPLYVSYSEEINQIINSSDIRKITIVWQILLQSISEIKNTYDVKMHFEMIIIKAMHIVNIPDVEDIIQSIENEHSSSNTTDKINEAIKANNQETQGDANDTLRYNGDTIHSDIENYHPKTNNTKVHSAKNLTNNKELTNVNPEINRKLYQLIEASYQQYDFDLYYYLFNEIEVVNISNGKIEMIGNYHNSDINKRLIALCSKVFQSDNNIDWNTSFRKEENFTSFKNLLRDKFCKSTIMQTIKDAFPKTELLDILIDGNIES